VAAKQPQALPSRFQPASLQSKRARSARRTRAADQCNDDMSRNRQSVGHAAVVGFPPKEMLQPLHHSHRVNWNCLNLVLFYLRHAFGFNTFSVTRMCSDRQCVGLRPLQRCRLGHETAVVAWSPCVCCRGRSGSRGLAAKPTRLTHLGHGPSRTPAHNSGI
jgi:hypothetical protein